MVTEFERRVSEILNVKYVVAVSNATTALEIASRALGLYGEVIVPSYTFIATAHALQWQGITPVFCDIHPETHNIDPSLIEQLKHLKQQVLLCIYGEGLVIQSH